MYPSRYDNQRNLAYSIPWQSLFAVTLQAFDLQAERLSSRKVARSIHIKGHQLRVQFIALALYCALYLCGLCGG